MIDIYKNEYKNGVIDFITKVNNSDFYFTEDNKRIFINNENSFNKIENLAKNIFVYIKNNKILGIIFLLESNGNNVKRDYIKLNVLNEIIASQLISNLLDNINTTIFIKINKISSLIKIFYINNFKFYGDRGSQILLTYKK